jgi:hypothetical protein
MSIPVLLLLSAFTMLGVDLPAEGSPAELAQAVAGFLIGVPDPAATEEPQTQTGEAEEVELGDEGPTAAFLTVKSDIAEGVLIVYKLQDGVLSITIAAGYPGEFNNDLKTLGLAVAGSISYQGTADDL